jgi:hypothetical protein
LGLCRKERIENSLCLFWIESRSGVFHRDDNRFVSVVLCAQSQYPPVILDAVHRFDGISPN